jgi:hypothetical protein
MAAALLLLALALACGKYGPPLRAGQARAEKPAPRLEVPLPAPPEAEPAVSPESEPAAGPEVEVEVEVEEEPPPEGAP